MTNEIKKAYEQGYADALEENLEMLHDAVRFDKSIIDIINGTIDVMHTNNLKLTELNKALEEKEKSFTDVLKLIEILGGI